jgi:hypothetical protein
MCLAHQRGWAKAGNATKGALMGTLSRLDTLSPHLANVFRDANDEQRRRATLAACLAALAQTGLQGGDVDAALALLRNGRNDRSNLHHKLENLAAQLDEQYFRLSEESDATAPEALATFRKARAAAALAFAISPDSAKLHEAIYEAIAASRDQIEALRAAEAALAVS